MRYLKPLVFLLVICLTGCTENVKDVELPDHEPKLVVQGYLVPNQVLTMFVGKSRSIEKAAKSMGVKNAEIKITGGGNTINQFTYLKNGYYGDTGRKFKAGKTYTLTVSKKGFETISAKTTIPKAVPIQEVEYNSEAIIDNQGDKRDRVSIQFKDPGSRNNFYEIRLIKTPDSSLPRRSPVSIPVESRDPAVDFNVNQNVVLLEDGFINGKTYDLTINFNSVRDSSKLLNRGKVILRSVNKAYFKYKKKLNLQASNENSLGPFRGEPVQIYSNVENGYGVFAGYHETEKRLKP